MSDRFRFGHLLTQDAAYGALLRSNRALLHGAAADVLATQIVDGTSGEAELLAALVEHLALAGRAAAAHQRCCALLLLLANTGDIAGWHKQAAQAEQLWARARQQDPALPELSIELLRARATLDRLQGRMNESEQAFRDVLELAEASGNAQQIALSHSNLGATLFDRGLMAEAVGHLRAAHRAVLQTTDRSLLGRVLNNLGIVLFNLGEGDEARQWLEAAVDIAEELGDRRRAGMTSGNLGVLHEAQGRRDEALACYTYELETSRDTGSFRGEGMALTHLGGLHVHAGRLAEAQACYQEDLERSRATGDRANAGVVLGHLAHVVRQLGDRAAALRLYEESYTLGMETHSWRFAGQSRMGQATLALEDGDLAIAATRLGEAQQLLEATGDIPLLGRLHYNFALLALATPDGAPPAAQQVIQARAALDRAQACAAQAGLATGTSLSADIAELEGRLTELAAGTEPALS